MGESRDNLMSGVVTGCGEAKNAADRIGANAAYDGFATAAAEQRSAKTHRDRRRQR